MSREYTILPYEYIEEMQDLTDEEFGELMRALIIYSRDGTKISCKGKGNIFRVRLMNNADRYAGLIEAEADGKAKRSEHARAAANARWNTP